MKLVTISTQSSIVDPIVCGNWSKRTFFSFTVVRGLPRKRKNHQQRGLLCTIGAIEGRNRGKSCMKRKKILFLQDNAPAHKSIATTAKINDLKLQLLPHPPYSPDLAPSDYYLFPNLKRWLINKKFSSREEIIDAAEEYFADLSGNYVSDGIKKLENRWNKCIELKGDYIE